MTCTVCDRPACAREDADEAVNAAIAARMPPNDEWRRLVLAAHEAAKDCAAHAINWRARCFAAEARAERLAGLLARKVVALDRIKRCSTRPSSDNKSDFARWWIAEYIDKEIAECDAALASEEPEEGPLDVDHPEAGT